ncbi:MAG: hypothetical protein AABX51_00430 [Nanoarchaeota archaeon]
MKNKILIAVILTVVLASFASALEIASPVEGVYNTTQIQLNLSSNQTLDTISYTLNTGINASSVLACTNCSEYSTTLNLSEGNYTILANGVLGNDTYNDSLSFSILLPAVIAPVQDFTLALTTPQNQTYNSALVPFTVLANRTLDNMSRKIDSGDYVIFCSNCFSYNNPLNLSEGNHTLLVKGSLGNITHELTRKFTILLPQANLTNQTNGTGNNTQNVTTLNLSVISPVNRTYNTKYVQLNFITNINATINYTLDGNNNNACSQCTSFTKTVELQNGSHTLVVRAYSGNQTDSETKSFTVNVTPKPQKNFTNETGKKFDKFNKLPQMLENGEITDDELAQLIRVNKINPGVINRLIKTGVLGNASLEAILDTQFNPPGILGKLLSALGFKQKSFSELIEENYNSSGKVKLKILGRDDLPKGFALKIKEELRTGNELKIKQEKGKLEMVVKESSGVTTKVRVENKGNDDSKKGTKSFIAGKQGKINFEDDNENDDKKDDEGKNKRNGRNNGNSNNDGVSVNRGSDDN